MKNTRKLFCDSVRLPSRNPTAVAAPKLLLVWVILFVSSTYAVYTLRLLSSPHVACDDAVFITRHTAESLNASASPPPPPSHSGDRTRIEHIVFGIAASAKLWDHRKQYLHLWWKPELKMRGTVWLDRPVQTLSNETGSLPRIKISSDTSRFVYKNRQGHRSAIRLSRIVSETLRLDGDMEKVRWLVMGDDDTVFVTDNLLRVLNKYDYRQYYYIGSSSESHLQNIYFSYNMAYGGGGFAISYPLAKVLERIQDRCIQRYPGLYGSDDRIQACMAELGVPLTKELGFHQYDVYGNLLGLLSAHPVAPLVSLHHLDVVEPIFPNMTQVEALRQLQVPIRLDSAGLMQQSICYDKTGPWTVSVSWGFVVQVFRGVLSPREIEMPSRTFLNWYRRADYKAYAFNTRPVMRNPCQKPFVFYLSQAGVQSGTNQTISIYARHDTPQPECRWKMADPAEVDTVVVYKKPDTHLWDRSPRRNCCRATHSSPKRLTIDVGLCKEGEISEV